MKHLKMTLAGLLLGSIACESTTGVLARGVDDDGCRGAIGAITVEIVIVPQGASCTLTGTRVDGNVEVRADAVVVIQGDAFVGGNVQAENSANVTVVNSHVNGSIQTENTEDVVVQDGTLVGGNIQIGQGGSARIANTTVDGDIQLEQNASALTATANLVDGNFQVFGNTGGVTLLNNTIQQNLQCTENSPAPNGSGNTAGSKEDQCAAL